jgi:hypothetical protein
MIVAEVPLAEDDEVPMDDSTRNPLYVPAVQAEMPPSLSSETQRDSVAWERLRVASLLLVLGLHVVVVALLLAESGPAPGPAADNPPIEIVYLPPVKHPQALADSAHPKHVNIDVGLALALPDLGPASLPAPVSQNGGRGAGVNWTAEAHRALKAFEIRRDEHVIHSPLGTSIWDGWAAPAERHPDDRYRNESGDWLVWIDSNCYQIASWHEGELVVNETPPQSFCVDASGAGRRAATGPKTN